MIISFNGKKLIAAVLAVVAAAGIIAATAATAAATDAAAYKTGKTVVIDAGHGGIDGGVTGTNTGTKESDINLAIARALKKALEGGGYRVVMTRSNTDGLYGLSSKNKKQKDMATRKEIINSAGADLVISIHQNFYPRRDIRGAQVFYYSDSETSKEMAQKLQALINLNLESCSRSAMAGDYFILQCSSVPSVLVECGFLSNPEDEKLLVSAKYQERIAYTLLCGINEIFDIMPSR